MSNRELAQSGEKIALEYLLDNGLTLVEKNFRCEIGEIDIILYDKETLVFCEVKTRQDLESGHPLEYITKRKLGKITKVAQYYMLSNNIDMDNQLCRIDAVGIYFDALGAVVVEWIKNCTG